MVFSEVTFSDCTFYTLCVFKVSLPKTIAKCQRKISMPAQETKYFRIMTKTAIFTMLYLRNNATRRCHLVWVDRPANFHFLVTPFVVAHSPMHKRQKNENSEKKQPTDSNVIGYLATLLKQLSGLGVTMTTKTWPLGCRTFHAHCAPLMFSRIPGRLSSNLLVSSVAILNSDINVIMAIMLQIMGQIGKCAGRKTH